MRRFAFRCKQLTITIEVVAGAALLSSRSDPITTAYSLSLPELPFFPQADDQKAFPLYLSHMVPLISEVSKQLTT